MLGQQSDVNQLKDEYKQYFKLNREGIYLHVNKDYFISGETIFFTGHLYNPLNIKPLDITTNLYVGLYNSKGKQLEKSMWYVKNGRTYGNIKIKPEYKHGSYYLKANTNWMRNFKDQVGYIKKIEILEYEIEESNLNKKKYSIRFVPEGGQTVANIKNTFGFQIIDEKGLGIPLEEGEISDSSGNIILQNIASNDYGIGKFNIHLKENHQYSCRFTLKNGQILQKDLPLGQKNSFALNITGSLNDTRMINVRTNPDNLNRINKKKFYLAIHRAGQLKMFTLKFEKYHKALSVNKGMLLSGVNVISFLDQDFNVLAERVIFNHNGIKRLDLKTDITPLNKGTDTIQLILKIEQPPTEQMAISVSIVPEKVLNSKTSSSIIGELFIKPYLDGFSQLPSNYLQEFNNKTVSELDVLFLIHGKSNFSWETFRNHIPKEKYSFHQGILIEGFLKNKKIEKLNSIAIFQNQIDLMKTAEFKKGREFSIQNAYIYKGEPINLTLLGQKGRMEKPDLELNFFPKMTTDSIDISLLDPRIDSLENDQIQLTNLKQLAIEKTVALDNITLKATSKKNEPTINPRLTTGFWNAKKITPEDLIVNKNLSNYLRSLGFKVKVNSNQSLLVLPKLTIPLMQPPIIYLNGFRLRDELMNFSLNTIDEVYYEHAGLTGSNGGTIYIYRKAGSLVGQESQEYFSKTIAQQGFERPVTFQMMFDADALNDTFKNYGSIAWKPAIVNDASDQFYINIPKLPIDRLKIIVEGIAKDGTIISEVKIIDLPKN